MDNERMPGWLLARLELAIAAAVSVINVILFAFAPPPFNPGSFDGSLGTFTLLTTLVPAVAVGMGAFGLVWMIRIWRGPLRDVPPAWRYRCQD